MRREARFTLIAAAAASLLAAAPARAQPMAGGAGGMPDLRAISGKPLPDSGMVTGTVSVRVARQRPANGAGGVEITAIIKNAGGDLRKRTAKTDQSGRALFEGLVPGDEFHAEVTVDGEHLKTDTFPLPAQGGVRTMLIAGLGAAPAGGGAAAEGAAGGAPASEEFALGIPAGSARPDPSMPDKTLEVTVLDEQGQPIAGHTVTLGAVDQTNKLQLQRATTDAKGVARFVTTGTGSTMGYAAIIQWHGLTLGTEPFAMPDKGGARAQIHALTRTADPSVVTIGTGARVVLQMREDTLQFLEMLPLENSSDKLFDPGPGAVEIPLPKGFVGAEAAESERKVDVRQNYGMAVHGPITPKRALGGTDAKAAGNEVTFGFVLPYHGDSRDFEQPIPAGMGPFTLIIQEIKGLSVSGPGLGAREEKDLGGRKFWVMPAEAIPPGGVLKFSITGLPSTDETGRIVSGVLALALVGSAIAFGRRPKDEARRAAADERGRLTAQRETLFAELVAVEKGARSGSVPAAADRRRDLIARLEGIYQQLAALDEQRAL